MNFFPLIDLYPISDRPLSTQEIQYHEHATKMGITVSPLRTQQTVRTPKEFVAHTLNNYGRSGIVCEFRSRLDSSIKMRSGKAIMPFLKDVPALRKYRDTPQISDLEAVNLEIIQWGSLMHPGQILFHGGEWPLHNNHIITNKPLSVSFCPQIAAWHAYNALIPNQNPNPVILILRVANLCSKKAIVFRKGGANMENEREVIFEKGAAIRAIQPPIQIQTASAIVSIIEADIE